VTVPTQLVGEQRALETEIREAFKNVSREGGTSWNEGWAIDLNGSDEECAAARARDNETSWEELVDDPNWSTNACPWAFLDAIGFRYYLAPAMIRDVRKGYSEWLADALNHPIDEAELRSLMTQRQFAAVDRYFRFLIAVSDTWSPPTDAEDLRNIYRKWRMDAIGERLT
jgi:hypothetical protein